MVLLNICFALVVVMDGNIIGETQTTNIDNIHYLTTDQILSLGEGARYFADRKFKESVRFWGKSFVFSPENQYVIVDNVAYNMGIPTKLGTEGFFVPARGFFEVVAIVFSKNMTIAGDTVKLYTGAPAKNEQIVPEAEDRKQEGDKKGKIVIDPGHGGKDPGAIGQAGTQEKVITLAISRYVAEELKNRGFDVILTRETDEFIPLGKRTEFANKDSADLFVSIHCNASKDEKSNGTQVFYLSPSRTDEARATALLENRSLLLEDSPIISDLDELKYIVADMAQAKYQRESSICAYLVEKTISSLLNLTARGPEGAEFYVLYGAAMPAILVEVAFISNPDEERILLLPKNQQKIARAIVEGIVSYWENIR